MILAPKHAVTCKNLYGVSQRHLIISHYSTPSLLSLGPNRMLETNFKFQFWLLEPIFLTFVENDRLYWFHHLIMSFYLLHEIWKRSYITSKRGLWIIESLHQCHALLRKSIVRSLLPESGPWNELLGLRAMALKPRRGGLFGTMDAMVFLPGNKASRCSK